MTMDPYAVLGVSPDASDAEVKSAFRRRARETHPDSGGTQAAFIEVRQAWELVGTPEARQRLAAQAVATPTGPVFEADAPDVDVDFDVSLGDLLEVFFEGDGFDKLFAVVGAGQKAALGARNHWRGLLIALGVAFGMFVGFFFFMAAVVFLWLNT